MCSSLTTFIRYAMVLSFFEKLTLYMCIDIGCLCFYSVRGNSAGYLQRIQIKPFIAECFTYKKYSIHRNGVIQHEFPLSQTLNRHGSSKDKELQLQRENAHLSLCSP